MGVGRPKHQPTDETRNHVSAMCAVGITHEQIAAFLGISSDTLVKYYQDEIRTSSMKANVKVANSLYQQAISGNVTAQIFWCKTRMGWRDVSHHEHTGADGGPLVAVVIEK